MKAVLIGALAATAYSADTILYPGTYKVPTGGKLGSGTCCYPDANGVTVTQPGGAGTAVTVAWKFEAGCAAAAADGKSVTGGNTPASGAVTFSDTVSGLSKQWVLKAPTAANGEFTLDLTNLETTPGTTPCGATLVKQLTGTATYPGTYEVTKENGTPASCCYPAGDVIVKQVPSVTPTQYNVEWTFDTTTTGCNVPTAQGKTISAANTVTTGTGAVAITDTTSLGKVWTLEAAPITEGDFLLDLTNLGASLDCSASLKRRTIPPLTAGTYKVKGKTGTDSACCWPAGDVVISKDATKVNLDWTFGETTGCTTTFKKQKITGGATPDVATGDVIFTDTNTNVAKTWTLDVPVTSTGDLKLDLNSAATGCSVTLEAKSTFEVSYPGVYEVETPVGASTKTCCYPDGDVKVTQDKTTKKVTVGWTFENTDECYNAAVKGKVISGGEIPDSEGDIVFQDSTAGVGKTWTLIAPNTADGKFTLDLTSVGTGCSAILDDKSGYLLGLGSLVALSLSYIVF